MKKTISLLLSIILLITITAGLDFSAYADSSGSCGENATYVIDSTTKTLTISGSGEITASSVRSWFYSESKYNRSFNKVIINEGITKIGEKAFKECTSIISVDIPNGVTSIGNDAFSGCTGLTSIDIPNSVTQIGDNAFYNCSSIISFEIPDSVTDIGMMAFYGCKALTNVTIPESISIINVGLFCWCSNLTSVTIPNSVTAIYSNAFSACKGLTSIKIPNSVTGIGVEAFANCNSLTSVIIPNSETSISWALFRDCSSLASITIPKSVTKVWNNAFSGCTNLKTVYYTGTETEWNNIEICEGNDNLTANTNITFNYTPTCDVHTVVTDEAVEPTCTQNGLTEGSHCSVCGQVFVRQEIIEAHHTYCETIVPPTCKSLGYMVDVCKVCGQFVINKYYDKVEHDFKEGEKYCTFGCGTVNPDFECEHNWNIVSRSEATCTASGNQISECSLCGEQKSEIIPIAEHTFVEERFDATPNAQGYTKYTCPVCSYAYVEDITPFASDASALETAIAEAHYYSNSKFSAGDIQFIIDEAESHRALSETNAPQSEYDYAIGEILTAIYSVDELAAYTPVEMNDDFVLLQNENGDEATVSFEESINEYTAPLDVVKDGIVNAKDFAYLLKNY